MDGPSYFIYHVEILYFPCQTETTCHIAYFRLHSEDKREMGRRFPQNYEYHLEDQRGHAVTLSYKAYYAKKCYDQWDLSPLKAITG